MEGERDRVGRCLGGCSREMETDAERKMERDNTRGKEKCRERYEIDTQREGNTERDPKKLRQKQEE